MPSGAEAAPTSAAMIAMPSGVFASGRAAAGGISRSATISSAPTIFSASATSPATRTRKATSASAVLRPSATAISRLTVIASKGRHIAHSASRIATPPSATAAIFAADIASTSPNR